MSLLKKQKSVLLALIDIHHGFYVGAARYAREHGCHLVTDIIYTASVRHDLEGLAYEAAALLDHLQPARAGVLKKYPSPVRETGILRGGQAETPVSRDHSPRPKRTKRVTVRVSPSSLPLVSSRVETLMSESFTNPCSRKQLSAKNLPI